MKTSYQVFICFEIEHLKALKTLSHLP